MRKLKKGRKLSRKRGQRKALLRSQAEALFLREKIKTTQAKTRELSSFAEKLITIAKKGNIAARRDILRLFSPKIAKKLINDIGPRYKERKGGYTRIIKIGPREQDGAKMAIIELVK